MKKWFWIIWVVSIKSHNSWKAENPSQLWSVRQIKWKNECEQLHVCQYTLWQQNGVLERWQCVKDPVHHGQCEDGGSAWRTQFTMASLKMGEREHETQKETKNCWSLDFSPDRPMLDHWSNQQFQSIIFSTHFYKTFFLVATVFNNPFLQISSFLAQDTNLAWFFDFLDYSFLACLPYFEFSYFSQSFILFTF